MLYPSEIKNVKFSKIYKVELQDNKIVFSCIISRYEWHEEYEEIGYYNLETKEGRIILPGYKDFKWYKNLKSIYNAIYKYNETASINSLDSIKEKIEKINSYNKIIDNNKGKFMVTRLDTITNKTFKNIITWDQLNNITKYPSTLYKLLEVQGL